MSLLEVVISAVQDKLKLACVPATLGIGGLMAVLSPDPVPDHVGPGDPGHHGQVHQQHRIVGVALISIVVPDWIMRRMDEFGLHLNAVSSFKVGTLWRIFVVNVTPIILHDPVQRSPRLLTENYGDYSDIQINVFGAGRHRHHLLRLAGALRSCVARPTRSAARPAPTSASRPRRASAPTCPARPPPAIPSPPRTRTPVRQPPPPSRTPPPAADPPRHPPRTPTTGRSRPCPESRSS